MIPFLKKTADNKSMRKIESFFTALGLFTVTLLLSLYCLETLGRKVIAYNPHQLMNQQYFFDEALPHPYSMTTGNPTFSGINPLGHPGAIPNLPKPGEEFRICILGGSTVFTGGHDGSGDGTNTPPLPELLEKIYQEHGHKNVRVYNFGNTGHVTNQDLVKLVMEVVDYQPDLVIFYGVGNDFMTAEVRPGYPSRFVLYESNPLWSKRIEDYPWMALTLYGSSVLRKLLPDYFEQQFFLKKEVKEKIKHSSPAWEEAVADNYLKAITKASVISHAYGSKFLAVYQPLLDYKQKIHERERAYLDGPIMLPLLRSRIQEKALQSLGDKGHFLDLSDHFSQDPRPIFADRIHLNSEANLEVAQTLFQHLNKKQHLALTKK